ncbi:Chromodomain-helicase-DNA-binding protein 8 [Frankliniella fusca]|uniref:Chromodomain-helicase-DNA-binding protein 8 n=1 Tax=Frankliniella fusca TaxID=407009 RepID=A0AAE1I288_9NEOP|nr:Chromodomain-helicase-DNA-binding protein 8 [Frankliniella fusca]
MECILEYSVSVNKNNTLEPPATDAHLKSASLGDGKPNGIINGVADAVHLKGVKNGFSNGDSRDTHGETFSGFSYGCITSNVCSSLSNGMYKVVSNGLHEKSVVPMNESLKRAENGEGAATKLLGVNGGIAVSGS